MIARLGIEYPIIQGPLGGGPSTPELVAAVSNAGGLGSLGAAYLTPDQITEAIRRIRALTSRPFSVNLFSGAWETGASVDAAAARGDAGFLSLWAGRGVARARALPAGELVRCLAKELDEAHA